MATAKITKKFLDSLPPGSKRYTVYDAELKGFGVRFAPSGLVTYIVEYRPHGGGRNVQKKRMSIGKVGEITPDQARNLARDRLSEVRHGQDPLADRQSKRRELTMMGLIDLWDIDNPPGRRTGKPMAPRTKRNTLARLRHHVLPILGRKRVTEVRVEDVNDFIQRVSKGETARNEISSKKRGRIKVRGGAGAARKVAGDLSIIFSYAIEKGIVAANPVSGARKPKPGKRYDFLSEVEFAALGKALTELQAEGVNATGIAILRLILLTGARPSEIEQLQWSEVDFKTRTLRLTQSKTGYSARPISQAALDLIGKQRRREDNPCVFPASRGKGHFAGSKKIWVDVRTRAGLPGRVRYHARHAVASIAISEGVDILSVAAMLGHKSPRTTLAVYAHVIDNRASQAADLIGEKIAAAIETDATPLQREEK